MRSSVVESSPSAGVATRGQRQQSTLDPRVAQPNPNRPHSHTNDTTRKSKHRLVLAPNEGWLPLFLLAIAVYCVVFSISAVGWVQNTFILTWSAAAGLLVGLVIAKINRLPQAILHLAACLIGHWLSIWLTSAVAFHIFWGLLIAGIGSVLTDPTRINNSSAVFLFYLSFLSFFLGYFGAWLVYRAHLPWLVAIVYCAIFLINLSYVSHDISFAIALLLASLILLIARVQLSANLVQWKSEGLYTDNSWLRGITWRIMRIASAIMVIAIIGSWLSPILGQPNQGVTFWNYLDNAWANITQGHISPQNLGSLLQPYQTPTNFFGDQLTISGSVHLPTGEVLNYSGSAAPQYLAGFTYDHFDGHTWTSLSSTTSQSYNANALLPSDTTQNYTTVTTSVTIVQPPGGTKHYLFGPAEPETFDVSTTLYGDTIIAAWAQQSALSVGEHYNVSSYLSTALPQDLEAVPLPQDSPDIWKNDTNYTALQAYYVQVPSDLTSNVQNTLAQWTQGATNTYDALKQIEAHLNDQTHFTYSLDNTPIPSNVDAADWLLQTHRGYCTYYATEMTIMARLLGIPTRMVNGFSRGHLDARRNVWVVDGSDAHSWVQAYFPVYGWINFDPTPGFALRNTANPAPVTTPVATPTKTKPIPAKTPIGKKHGTSPDPTTNSPQPNPATSAAAEARLVSLSIVALVIALLIFLVALARYWWRSLYPNSSFVAGTFWRLCRVASWVGLAPRQWQTPYEYSRALCRRVPQEAGPLWRLTELFVRERWGRPQQAAHPLAERELTQLSPGLRKSYWRLLLLKVRKG